jgi:hypothetical protein
MALRDGLFQMPPLGTSRADEEGIDIIRRWIIGLNIRAIIAGLSIPKDGIAALRHVISEC